MRPRIELSADRQARSDAGRPAIARLHPVEFVEDLVQIFRRAEFSADRTAGRGGAILTPWSWVKLPVRSVAFLCVLHQNQGDDTMRHGRLGSVALLVLCGFLSAPSRVAAQQFPPFPDPVIDNSFNGGTVPRWWRKPSGREATPRDIRPVVRKAASVTNAPIARPPARLRKPAAASVSRQQAAAQSARPNAAAWWKRLKNDPAVRSFRDCVVSYTAGATDRDKDATLSSLLIRATEGSCRSQADALMHVLAQRAGQSGIEPVMRELVQSVFVPAARSALTDSATAETAATGATASIKASQPAEALLDR
jgi:hypothetical protein